MTTHIEMASRLVTARDSEHSDMIVRAVVDQLRDYAKKTRRRNGLQNLWLNTVIGDEDTETVLELAERFYPIESDFIERINQLLVTELPGVSIVADGRGDYIIEVA